MHDRSGPDAPSTPHRRRPSSALVALAVGMLGSAAANTAWTWQDGPVRVVAGIFATALVPVAMHLWPRVPVGDRTRWRILRALVMTYICAAAAVVNLVHAVWLLTDREETGWLAFLLVTAVESVMVMASLALRRPAEEATQVTPSMSSPAQDPAPSRTPAPPPVPRPPSVSSPAPAAAEPQPGSKREAGLAFVRENPAATAKEVALAAGVSKGESYRILELAREAAS